VAQVGSSQHTFLFADLSGFTAFTEAHGDQRAVELVDAFLACARPLADEYHAEEIKGLGDGLMLRTDSAAAGVRLGRRLADEIGGRHAFPSVRVGANSGPAIERGGDWFGATVNLASRVAGHALAGEVLVTAATRDAAAGDTPDLSFVPVGAVSLRNVASPVELFTVSGDEVRRSSQLAIDPVCRMQLDPRRAAARVDFEGRVVYLCSAACVSAFNADPTRYQRDT
jgi:adenylate cyclase